MSWNTIYLVDLAAILLFMVSYYRGCVRAGYRIDFWHAELLLTCIFPYLVMLFFSRNVLNAVILGHDFTGAVAAAPMVFLIVIVGYVSILVGGRLWHIKLGIGLRKAGAQALDTVPRCSLMVMSSRSLLSVLSVGCLLLQALLLLMYFRENGFGLDLRAYTFAHPATRPLAQIAALSSVWIASHCLARYVDTKEKALLGWTLLLTFGLIFFGQRGNIFSIYMNVGLCYLIRLRSRISFFRLFGSVALLVGFGLYLGNAREGIYSIGEFLSSIAFLVLYGNNFTDFRDFTWMYSDWNHVLWTGKTYLAGLATFLPREISSFRADWSFGIATGWTVGLDTDTHPGLKPGLFGEGFFNFGWLGVVVVGLLYGIILRRIDIDVKAAMGSGRPSMRKAFASTTLLSVAACIANSLNLPSLYALGGIYLFSWIYLQTHLLLVPRRLEAV